MKVTCPACGGCGKQVTTHGPVEDLPTQNMECLRCQGTGRVESRPRHTSLTLACCCQGYDEDACDHEMRVEDAIHYQGLLWISAPNIVLDAESEASLLKFLKSREGERR